MIDHLLRLVEALGLCAIALLLVVICVVFMKFIYIALDNWNGDK